MEDRQTPMHYALRTYGAAMQQMKDVDVFVVITSSYCVTAQAARLTRLDST